MKISKVLLFSVLVITIAIASCRKKSFQTDPTISITSQSDSILFDTVFTRIGSTTKYFKIYNPDKKKHLIVSSISLAGGTQSSFRLNINGQPYTGTDTDIEIPPNDSLYIFVEVTVDPTTDLNPFLIKDSVLFLTNGNSKKVILTAFGRNANYIKGSINGKIGNEDWDSTLPYLIYDYAYVDTNKTLTIKEGTELYFHGNTSLHVFGTLNVEGTYDHPVIFQGSRLESDFDELAGQWGGIHLWRDSKQNHLNHVEIKNSIYGIRVDSLAEDNGFKLVLQNSIIKNTTASAILGFTGSIYADNTLIYNCGLNAIRLEFGGYYRFNYLTVEGSGDHRYPLVRISNYYSYNGEVQYPAFLDVEIRNTIMSGTLDEEFDFSLAELPSGYNSINFINSLIVTEDADESIFTNCIVNQSPAFLDVLDEDFRLTSISPCVDYALSDTNEVIPVPYDINENSRPQGLANDIGCYETH